jgi:hypothetical protein
MAGTVRSLSLLFETEKLSDFDQKLGELVEIA